MSIGRVIWLAVLAFVVAGLIYFGVWHLFTQFVWQHPMLGWFPLILAVVVGFIVGSTKAALGSGPTPAPTAPSTQVEDPSATAGGGPVETPVVKPTRSLSSKTFKFSWGWAFLAGFVVVLIGLWFTLISKPASGLDQINYEVVDTLPAQTEPRLLPRAAVTDDPAFKDAKEIHLLRDPQTGDFEWTGEWRGSFFGGRSAGVSIKPVSDVISHSQIHQTGFVHSVGGVTPSTIKGKAKLKHPFSAIQYPILVPEGNDKAIAMVDYMGYAGFPFRYPYLKGVMVYHQDGEVEDLTPEEAAARPDLAATGRIFPEKVARSQADALSRSDEFKGDIHDGEGNKQPYLTAIGDRTMWVTIIDDQDPSKGVKAIVMADSTTGDTQVWKRPPDQKLISSEEALNDARSLPLQWKETRCCDSDGDSYTVTLRQVVEARLAFKDGKPYYLVSVVPTDDLALPRDIEYTLLIDGESGRVLEKVNHVEEGIVADARLQAFFSDERKPPSKNKK
jgi:hypothetical protein